MKISRLKHCIGGLALWPMALAAQNPIVQTMYTADPAQIVKKTYSVLQKAESVFCLPNKIC